MITNNDYLSPRGEDILLRVKTTNKLYDLNSRFYFERYFDSRDINSITMEKHFNMDDGIYNHSEIKNLKESGYSYYINFNQFIHIRTKRFIHQFKKNKNIEFTDIFSKIISIDKHHDSSNRVLYELDYI